MRSRSKSEAGTRLLARRFLSASEHMTRNLRRERNMPVIILWAIPAVIVIGGGAYWIMHLH
jgi:hypothetical protein